MNLSKSALVILILMVILGAAAIIYIKNAAPQTYKPGIWPEADQAVAQAEHLYNVEKVRKTDLTSGPCLSNALISGWVLDLVHNPRIAADDLPENQCRSYLEGTAQHLVEMDLTGRLIRVK